MKHCPKCDKDLDEKDFYLARSSMDGLTVWCKECNKASARGWYALNREKAIEKQRIWSLECPEEKKAKRAKYYAENKEREKKNMQRWYRLNRREKDSYSNKRFLRLYYKMSEEDYEKRYKEQNGCCAICKGNNLSGRRLSVDHNHATGYIRGLLCGNCNLGIGNFKDNVEFFKTAIEYLQKEPMTQGDQK